MGIENVALAQLKLVARKVLEDIEVSPDLSAEAIGDRLEGLKKLVELYAPDLEGRFNLLCGAYSMVIAAVVRFYTNKEFKTVLEAL